MSSALPVFESVARVGVAILANSLWQGALIAFATWLALRLFPKANASTRYAAWALALLAIVVIPVATSLSRVSVASNEARQTQPVHVSAPAETHAHAKVPPATYERPLHASTTTAPPSSGGTDRSFRITVPSAAAAITFAAWMLAALVVLLRLVIAFVQLERLKHNALPLDVAYRDAMPRWRGAVKGERDVRICVSNAIDVPIAVGIFDSMILLPASLVASLDTAEVDQITLHELAHLLRNDDWTNGLQRLAGALLFFNPAVWFVSRQLDLEREVACDDYVLELTGAVRPYAFCLTKMAEMTSWPHRPLPAPGVFVTRKNISIRIERLLRTGRAIGSRIAPSVASAVVVALIALFLVLRTMTPSIAFTLPPVPTIAAIPPAPHAHAAPKPVPAPSAVKEKIIIKRVMVPSAVAVSAAAAVSTAVAIPPAPQLRQRRPVMAALPKNINVSVPMPNIAALVAQAKSDVLSSGCRGCDFGNANLAGKDFRGRGLTGSNFEGANLNGARFDRARLDGVNFEHADLRNASFVDAHMTGCNLDHAQLAGARFDGAEMTGCNVDVTQLSADQARGMLSRCAGCNFEGAHLAGQDLHGIRLSGTNLANADLRNADLRGVRFTGVNFEGANLSGARVDGASFLGCNFDHVDLRNVDLSNANITGSNMSAAILRK